MRILLVDTTAIMYRYFFRYESESNTDTIIFRMCQNFLNTIFKLKAQFNIDKVILAQEGYSNKNKTNWRIRISDKYKQNRINDGPSNTDKASIIKNNFFTWCDNFVKNTNVTQIAQESCEADDVIASIVNLNDKDIFYILADDKDFQQLMNDRVRIVSIKDEKLVESNSYGDVRVHAIIGDASDNVDGLKRGIGVKSAEKIVNEGLLEKFLNDNDLNEQYNINLQLVSLKLIPIELQNKIYEQYKLSLTHNTCDIDYCTELIMNFRLKIHLNIIKK